MKKATEKGALDLIEEATHLLRRAPSRALLCYYTGALPFVLGVLYFWSDMSRSAFALQRLPQGALGLALLLTWMKSWQAVFARHLLAELSGEPVPRWHVGGLMRLWSSQTALQPAGLFLLPIALLLTVPFPWTCAFFQNLTVLGATGDNGLGALMSRAWRQARFWPAQNVTIQMVLFLFGMVVFLDVIAAVIAGPVMLDMFFGIQTIFTQTPWAVFNSTFLAAVLGLTYLCLDPLAKAVYVLRCFYGESLQSGADLKADLRSVAESPRLAIAALVLLTTFGVMPVLNAAGQLEGSAPASPPSQVAQAPSNLSPPALNAAIDRVIDRREFVWRWPREKTLPADREAGILAGLWDWFSEHITNAAKAVGRWIRDVFRWLRDHFSPKVNVRSTPGDWTAPLRALTVLLIAALVALLLWLLWRMWRQHLRLGAAEVTAEPSLPAPDVADENVGAEQLPEDGWITLARDLWGRGELRLALRAFYLSSLAHLADRNLIALAKFKSNLDYARELGRRAHALPELPGMFGQTIFVFDRVWYGLHEVNGDLLDQFARNVERIKAC